MKIKSRPRQKIR